MRLAIIILSLAAITVCLVHIRRGEDDAAREIQQLRSQQISLRRALWDMDSGISRLIARGTLRRQAGKLTAVRLVPAGEAPRLIVVDEDADLTQAGHNNP